MKSQKKIFEEASRIVRTRGLRRRDFGTDDGPVCAVGAIYEAEFGNPQDAWNGDSCAAQWADERTVEAGPWDYLTRWSDRAASNADEVADLLWLLGQVAP